MGESAGVDLEEIEASLLLRLKSVLASLDHVRSGLQDTITELSSEGDEDTHD